MALSAVSQRWITPAPRDLPSRHLGTRRNRDRLSDLEAGTLAELAWEDDDETPTPEGKVMTIPVNRASANILIGVELDICARQPHSAAEVVIGAVTAGSPAAERLRVGDAVRKVNGQPCCTIEDVRREVGGSLELVFEVCRPRQAELHTSEAMAQTMDGGWVKVSLHLHAPRVLEIRQEGREPQQVEIRRAEYISVQAGRELHLGTHEWGGLAFRLSNTADLERWHTLLTQMMMFRPGTCCELNGWLQRTDGGAGAHPGAWQYFELYSTGTALVYSSPHRNKLGQALLAVALSQCSVAPDDKEAGAWLIRDVDRDSAVWRASSLQATRRDATVEGVLTAHALGAQKEAEEGA